MTDLERDRLANFIRAMSLKVEITAYAAERAPGDVHTQDFLKISAMLCEAADVLEAPHKQIAFDALSDDVVSANTPTRPVKAKLN